MRDIARADMLVSGGMRVGGEAGGLRIRLPRLDLLPALFFHLLHGAPAPTASGVLRRRGQAFPEVSPARLGLLVRHGPPGQAAAVPVRRHPRSQEPADPHGPTGLRRAPDAAAGRGGASPVGSGPGLHQVAWRSEAEVGPFPLAIGRLMAGHYPYVKWKQIKPEVDIGFDLSKEYAAARAMLSDRTTR